MRQPRHSILQARSSWGKKEHPLSGYKLDSTQFVMINNYILNDSYIQTHFWDFFHSQNNIKLATYYILQQIPSACRVPVSDHTRDHARHHSAKMIIALQEQERRQSSISRLN